MEATSDRPAIALVCCGLIGTLVADDGLLERAYAEAIATQGVVSGTSAFARRMSQVHQGRGHAPADVLGGLFPDNEARAQAAELAFNRSLADGLARSVIRPVPGARPAVENLLSAGCDVAVLTSLPRRILQRVLDAAGLRKLPAVSLSVDDVARGFPAPDLVLTAFLRAGAGDVRQIVVVNSTGAGVEAGRRAGAGVVAGVLTGPHPAARLRRAGATDVLPSIADLAELLLGRSAPATVSIPPQARLERSPAKR
ncbi:MAG TPA: HAD family phosphatase [Streptosporangiaceae bacterium]